MKNFTFLIYIFLGLGTSFQALGLDCNPLIGATTGFKCDEEDPDHLIEIKVRPMPGFGLYGGVTIVDICQFPMEIDDETMVNEPALNEKNPIGCVRRFCSRNKDVLQVIVDVQSIPLGGYGYLGLYINLSKHNFEIQCENIGSGENL